MEGCGKNDGKGISGMRAVSTDLLVESVSESVTHCERDLVATVLLYVSTQTNKPPKYALDHVSSCRTTSEDQHTQQRKYRSPMQTSSSSDIVIANTKASFMGGWKQ